MASLKQLIADSMQVVIQHPEFVAWLPKQRANDGDIIAFNNSFVFREIGTRKATHYLSLTCDAAGKPRQQLRVMTGLKLNSNYRHYSARQPDLPSSVDLDDAVEEQMDQIGKIVFVLIGQVEDDIVTDQALDCDGFAKVVWDPTQIELLQIDQQVIKIRDPYNEDALWQALEVSCTTNKRALSDKMPGHFSRAIEKLQQQAVARLKLPEGNAVGNLGVTDLVANALRNQRNAYKQSVDLCKGEPSANTYAYNDMLRIAYNFAGEALTFLRLILSICDLKPIVLWATIGEHHALSEAFRALPWTRSADKPSLPNYVNIIGNARNSAFHNILPFQKALNVALPETAFQDTELLFFSEYSGRSGRNRLSFQDKELVDVLLEFTRARSRSVSPDFWVKNLTVMDRLIELFEATSNVLKALYLATA